MWIKTTTEQVKPAFLLDLITICWTTYWNITVWIFHFSSLNTQSWCKCYISCYMVNKEEELEYCDALDLFFSNCFQGQMMTYLGFLKTFRFPITEKRQLRLEIRQLNEPCERKCREKLRIKGSSVTHRKSHFVQTLFIIVPSLKDVSRWIELSDKCAPGVLP